MSWTPNGFREGLKKERKERRAHRLAFQNRIKRGELDVVIQRKVEDEEEVRRERRWER